MKQLTIYQDNYSDSTVISNRFIDEYMKDANDAQIKVYLYLIRTMSAHMATSVSEMADVFNHTEKDVLRALKYWEKQKLLKLEYDDAKNLTGIHVRDLKEKEENEPEMVPVAPTVIKTAVTLSSRPAAAPLPEDTVTAANTAPAANTNMFEKPSYSLDDVKAFRNREDTEQLLFIIEAYVGKPLSSSDIRTILFICDRLHFSTDLVDYLVQYCVGRGKKDFRYIEKVAISWAEDHITTPKQAASLIKKYDKNVFGIMNALGKSGAPTDKEMEFIDRWNKQFQFPADVIKEACDRTVLATDRHRFEYADSILTSWNKAGVRQLSDVRTADESYAKARPAQKSTRPSQNKFNQFKQNAYDFSALESEILSN